MKLHYIILSTGCYSDYDATYYCGEKEITKEEIEEIERQACLDTYAWEDKQPIKKHKHSRWCREGCEEEVDPVNYSAIQDYFWKVVHKEVKKRGYEAVDRDVPEVNTQYSDLRFNKQGEKKANWWE